MSQQRGKTTRDRKRRLSDPAPYKVPAKTQTSMPTTRHSPVRGSTQSDPPMADLLRELASLRQSIDSKFDESGKKVDNLKSEVIAKLDANDQAVAELQLTVTDVTLSVDRNQRAIQEVRAEVERREVELPLRVKTIVQEALAARPPRATGLKPRPLLRLEDIEATSASPPPQDSTNTSSSKEQAYDKARRSIRIWPVSREGNLRDRAVEFLVNELLVDQNHAADLTFEVKRVGAPRARDGAQGVKDEILVTFDSIRTRDEIRSHAKNLERRGRGLRLEIPDHLWPSFRVLQNIGYKLKQKNGSLKRNILFDDDRSDLKMDIYVNSAWKTLYPEPAKASLKKMGKHSTSSSALSGDEIDRLLSAGENDENVEMENEEY